MDFIEGNLLDVAYVYQDMLTQFMEEELKSLQQLEHLVANHAYDLFIFKEGSKNIGYAFIHFNKNTKTLWLDYLAILKPYQSNGYGKAILSLLSELYPNMQGCFLEVEKIKVNEPNTLRRVNFYKKAGAKLIPTYYALPHINGHFEMDLYFLPFNNVTTLERSLCLEALHTAFACIHSDILHYETIFLKIQSEMVDAYFSLQ